MPTPTRTPARGDRAVLGLVVDSRADPVLRLRLQGRTLVSHALDVLTAVPGVDAAVVGTGHHGVVELAADAPWRPLADVGLVVHDPHCPLLSAETITSCMQSLSIADPRAVVVGVRPVTDTIKEVVDGAVVSTVDRDLLAALTSPVVVGPALLDQLGARLPLAGDLADLGAVVEVLASVGSVVPVQVPSSARRVSDQEDIELLECLHELRQTLRER